MNDSHQFSTLFNDIVSRSGKSNEELALILGKTAIYIAQLRNGSRLPENDKTLEGFIECFRKNDVQITNEEANDLHRLKNLESGIYDLRTQVELNIGLKSLESDLTEKIDDNNVASELRKVFTYYRDRIRELQSALIFEYDPEIMKVVVVPIVILDQLNRMDDLENLLFAAIGIFGGAGFGLLAENLSSDEIQNGEWALFFVLVIITGLLGFFLSLVRKNKTAIKQPYHNHQPPKDRS